jgi:hypothetical protein
MGMSTVRERAAKNAIGVASMLIFALGFVALLVGFNYFFLIWAIGYPTVLPLVAMLSDDDEDEPTGQKPDYETHGPTKHSDDETTDALDTLRDRYARGELTDEQFERKLDALLETENPENAAEWRTRERERIEE